LLLSNLLINFRYYKWSTMLIFISFIIYAHIYVYCFVHLYWNKILFKWNEIDWIKRTNPTQVFLQDCFIGWWFLWALAERWCIKELVELPFMASARAVATKKKRFCQSLYMDFTAHSSRVLPKIHFAIHVSLCFTPRELSSRIFLDCKKLTS